MVHRGTDDGSDRYPSIKSSFLLLLIFMGLQLAIGGVLGIAGITQLNFTNTIAIGIGGFVAIRHALRKKRRSIRSLLEKNRYSYHLYLVTAVTCVGASIVLSEIDNLVMIVIPRGEYWDSIFTALYQPENLAGSLLLAVIIAPLVEEILFRGIITDGFAHGYSKPVAIVVPALLWGLSHLNPWQFVTAFALGLYLSWLYYESRSLLACIATHAFFNLLSLLALVVLKTDIPGYTTTTSSSFQPLWFDLLGVALLCFGIYATSTMLRQRSAHEDGS